jgi:hypothetical protein
MGNKPSSSIFLRDGHHPHYLLVFVGESADEERMVTLFHSSGKEIEFMTVEAREIRERIILQEDKGRGFCWFLTEEEILDAANEVVKRNPGHCCRIWIDETVELLRERGILLSGEMKKLGDRDLYLVGVSTKNECQVLLKKNERS